MGKGAETRALEMGSQNSSAAGGMEKEIRVPVTRIEGHGKITIVLDRDGNVADAKFHVVSVRGFEKFCEGRLVWEMPVITSRICGICPVSHSLASAKAGDAILGIDIPGPAKKLRLLLHMGQMIQSHALSLFYLSLPDLVLGFDYEMERRNIVGLLESRPELARRGVALRKFGQEVIEALAGRRVHPTFAIPGGVNGMLQPEKRDALLAQIDGVIENARSTIGLVKDACLKQEEAIPVRTYNMGLVGRDGALEFYDGELRIKDQRGNIIEDGFNPSDYLSIIGERVEDWSYLKFPYYRWAGFPKGSLRVGPLGRLNVADRIPTPLAEEEFKEFKAMGENGLVDRTIFYHYARAIEMLHAAERAKELLQDEEICSKEIWNESREIENEEGVGVIEAPRGTLIHHYWVNRDGTIRKANLIVSTVFNNMGMNLAIKEVASKRIRNGRFDEGILNHVEHAIRCFDPCLSCATHAVGQMPLSIQLVSPDGEVLGEISRG